MPTVLTHTVVPLALGLGLGKDVIPRPLMAAGMAAAVLPDLDVIAFRFGVTYASGFGHRGFSHSLFFAVLVALIGACVFRYYRTGFARAFAFLFLSIVSHGVLDSFTNGGSGIAFLWPWSMDRFYAPVQFIEVSPLRLERVFSSRGITVLLSELVWVWTPLALVGLGLAVCSRAAKHAVCEQESTG
jgi:inner membrane protein